MKRLSKHYTQENKKPSFDEAMDDCDSSFEDQEDDGSIYQHLAAKGVSMISVYRLA